MKKLILLIAIVGFITQAQAQKMNVKDVPVIVTDAFYHGYPTIKDVDWSKDGNNYAAAYGENDLNKSVTYDVSGMLIGKDEEIVVSALPASVMVYVQKNYNEDEVKEASKITDTDGTVTFETAIKGTNLFFDSEGNFLRSEEN